MDDVTSTVYIDEAGDLGVCRGTKWFVLSSVVVDKECESQIRQKLSQIKTRINVGNIHLKKINDFYRRAFITREISTEQFTYVNVIVDTTKMKFDSSIIAYNFLCKLLLERVSWYLRDSNRTANIVLSSRGTSKDEELIRYIKEKLIPYNGNQIANDVFKVISAKSAGSWDLLQLADICATTTFLAHEINGWGFNTPCFLKNLQDHLYSHNNQLFGYGLKYLSQEMLNEISDMKNHRICTKKERIPGATTT